MTTPTNIIAPVHHQPRLADLQDGMLIEGIYRVSHAAVRSTPTWSSSILRLRDSSRTLQCLNGPGVAVGNTLAWRAVRVRFSAFMHPTYGLEGRIEQIDPVDDLPEELVLDLLPHPRSVKRDVRRLRALIEGLSPAMRSFCLTVLRDDRVTRALIVNPASRTFHHTTRGGLLAHCLETAEQAGLDCNACQEERETALVAGLFHDVGKTVTLNHHGFRTECGKLVAHESMTLEICASALRALERTSRRLALELRHAWTAAYPGQYGIGPKRDLVRVVRAADRHSARRNRGKTVSKAAQPVGAMH